MNQNEKDVLEEKIQYLKDQIMVLGPYAYRDIQDPEVFKDDFANAMRLAYSDSEDLEVYVEALHVLSSLVDKTKSGGWIAAHSTVYRVERHGRSYRNTDLISVQMVDKDYNGTDKLEQRAREIAAALNAL
jgi:ribosomal protein L16 Arg81 hydroxylase